jgi:hypothetical protein
MPVVYSALVIAQAKKALKEGIKAAEIKAELQDKALTSAKKIQEQLEREFDKHAVTKELQAENTRTSAFLSYGNIKAYFGLSDAKASSDMEAMRALFGSYNIKVTREQGTSNYRVKITFPKLEEFYALSQPPEGAYESSWLRLLEKGLLQNFDHFLFRRRGFKGAVSRSGTGIQIAYVILRGVLDTVPKIPYITDIYEKVLTNSKDKVKQIMSSIKIR